MARANPDARRGVIATSFNPPEVWQPFGAFALAAVQGEGRPVHLKGQVALDRDGRLVGKGDMRAQVRQVLENIRSALASVGGQMGDIISLTQYTTDMDAFMAAGDIRKQFFKEPYPVTTTVQVTRLYDPDLLIEITALAEIPPDRFRAPATSQGAPRLERRERKMELGMRSIEPGIRSGRRAQRWRADR